MELNGVIEIELGSFTPETQFVRIRVHGRATLGESLSFESFDFFSPNSGDTFEFLTHNTHVTVFPAPRPRVVDPVAFSPATA